MQSHAVSGTAVMMLLFGLAACGATLLQERDEGTLQRLQLSPASGASILLGKMIFIGLAGILQLVVLFAYGALVFDIPILRDPIALAVHSFAVVCAATGLGLVLAIACRTRKQLEGLSTLVILVMSALGGSWFPLIATPEWFQKLGHFTLNAWAMDGYQAILWYGKGVESIWVPFIVLMGIAIVTVAIAIAGWRRRFEVGT
jgi:ABC-2 type transport system permease protein